MNVKANKVYETIAQSKKENWQFIPDYEKGEITFEGHDLNTIYTEGVAVFDTDDRSEGDNLSEPLVVDIKYNNVQFKSFSVVKIDDDTNEEIELSTDEVIAAENAVKEVIYNQLG